MHYGMTFRSQQRSCSGNEYGGIVCLHGRELISRFANKPSAITLSTKSDLNRAHGVISPPALSMRGVAVGSRV
jgi:hypothetical protein